jgi:hypothetical protein
MTMITQGWGSPNGHGRLFEVMLVMEWIMDHLESWKDLYCEEAAELTNIPTPSSTKASRTDWVDAREINRPSTHLLCHHMQGGGNAYRTLHRNTARLQPCAYEDEHE